MRARLEKRLEELRTEFDSGQAMLADLDKKRADLQTTLTRISGAIQVLEEELVKDEEDSRDHEAPAEISPDEAEDQGLN